MVFKAPKPPDPVQTAEAQAEFNQQAALQSAQLNQINEVTPFGSVNFTGALGTPDRTRVVTLSPDEQAKLDLANQIAIGLGQQGINQIGSLPGGQLSTAGLPALSAGPGAPTLDTSAIPTPPTQGTIGDPRSALAAQIAPAGPIAATAGTPPQLLTGFGGAPQFQTLGAQAQLQTSLGQLPNFQGGVDFSGAPRLPGVGDFAGERQRIEGSLFDTDAGRINQQFDENRARLESQLFDRGIPRGSAAFNSEIERLERSRTDALQQASSAATRFAGQEQGRLFGQALSARGTSTGETLAAGSFTNQTARDRLAALIAGGQFRNAALGQQFGQNVVGVNIANQVAGLQSEDALTRAQFANQALQAGFGNTLGALAFQNQAQQQQFGQNLTQAEIANAARAQEFQELMARAGLFNTAGAQTFAQGLSAQEAQNAALAQQLGLGQSATQLQNAARTQGLTEQQLIRNQAINELAALLQGSQAINQPNVSANQLAAFGVQPAPFADLALANFQARSGQFGSTLGALAGLGSAAILASSRDFKEVLADIPDPADVDPKQHQFATLRDIAQVLQSLPIKAWRYRPDAPVQDYRGIHFGPLAEEFNDRFRPDLKERGDPMRRFIDMVDATGVIFATVKYLLAESEQMQRRIVKLERLAEVS